MNTARLSAKGQVTIPLVVRQRLGLRGGENVVFMEKFGDVFITSEKEVTPDIISKDERRATLHSLFGSINDPTFVEPAEVG